MNGELHNFLDVLEGGVLHIQLPLEELDLSFPPLLRSFDLGPSLHQLKEPENEINKYK